MILLSNSSKRVIGLRPIQISTITDAKNEPSYEDIEIKRIEAQQELKDTKIKAQQLLTETKEQIQIEKEAWDKEKQHWIEEAQKKGYQSGYEEGKDESKKQYEQLLEQAREIVQLTKQERDELIKRNEPFILNLSVEVARKIIHQSIIDKEAYIEIVKDVIKEAREQPTIQLFAHPDDYLICQQYKDELYEMIDDKADLRLYPDQELTKGSCIVETPFGRIEAGIDTQLNLLRQQLYETLEEINREA